MKDSQKFNSHMEFKQGKHYARQSTFALSVMKFFGFIVLLSFVSCQKYGLLLHQQRIDASYLASSHVGSPDPRQKCPPHGQLLIVEWWVPPPLLKYQPRVVVHLFFRNYTEKIIEFPITRRVSYEIYPVLGCEFDETGGLLTYKAEIVICEGEIYREWKHQMWVQLIDLSDEPSIQQFQ